MDGIEPLVMLPNPVALTLQERQPVALSTGFDSATRNTVAGMSDLRKQELAKDFESLLLTQLLDEVKTSISACSFNEDAGSDQVHAMFWSFLAEDVADKGGFGLWQDIYLHFKDLETTAATGELIDEGL